MAEHILENENMSIGRCGVMAIKRGMVMIVVTMIKRGFHREIINVVSVVIMDDSCMISVCMVAKLYVGLDERDSMARSIVINGMVVVAVYDTKMVNVVPKVVGYGKATRHGEGGFIDMHYMRYIAREQGYGSVMEQSVV